MMILTFDHADGGRGRGCSRGGRRARRARRGRRGRRMRRDSDYSYRVILPQASRPD